MPQVETEARVRSQVFSRSVQESAKPSLWKGNVELFQREVMVIWFVLKNPGTPWYARLISAGVAAYLLSPVQLIPSFIPVIGLLDDFVVLSIGVGLIRALTPKRVVGEARQRAEAALKRGENIRPAAVRITSIIIAGVWLLVTITVFFIFYRHI